MNDIDAIRELIDRVTGLRGRGDDLNDARAALDRIERLVEAGDAMADEIDAAGRRDDKGVLALIPTYTAFRAARKGGA